MLAVAAAPSSGVNAGRHQSLRFPPWTASLKSPVGGEREGGKKAKPNLSASANMTKALESN